MTTHALHADWQLKPRDPALSLSNDFASPHGWLGASVPGSVQQDLLAQGRIPDPHYGLNEHDVQWVGEQDWLYRLNFRVDEAALREEHLRLHFGGLDTFCTVWLNGEEVLRSENMFVPRSVDVKGRLRAGENTLHLHFESPLRVGHALEARYGKRAAWNGDTSRLYVRKAQYHYGWDWGPVLLSAGPWKEVELRAFTNAIEDLHVPSEVTPDLQLALVPVRVTLAGNDPAQLLEIELRDPNGEVVGRAELPATPSAETLFELPHPELWYPNGLGEQPLYRVGVTLRRGSEVLDERQARIGLRRLRVVQEEVRGEPGKSFTFEVNNLPFFAGGANWIPDDLLLNRITPERYRERLTQARGANMTMIRVWGGGIYEHDAFYDACDELGLLVWQDFMFGCGLYPAHAEFQASVRKEAEAAVRRLRNHPSLALWCGNNEDYAIAESVGASGPGGDESRFPAKVIYEGLLPEVCARLDPGRLYWPGSPWGGVNSADPTVGDRHSWEIWHGVMAPYQEYAKYEARFVSEFGLQSAPALSTLLSVLPPEERFPESRTVTHHNKASGPNGESDGHRRLAVYLSDNLRAHRDLEEFVYHTQFVQGEAMRYAYRDFRARFQGPGKYAVSGALVWQLNDCWPVTSWAIIDSQGFEKPAYYAIKRELATFSVGLRLRGGALETWVNSASTGVHDAQLDLYAYELDGTLALHETQELRLLPGRRGELPARPAPGAPLVYFAELRLNGQVVARAAEFPEPFKYHDFPNPELSVEVLGENTLRLTARKPAKGVWLDTDRAAHWDDNFLDLRPGEARTVTARDLGGQTVRLRFLNAPEALLVPSVLAAETVLT